MFGTFRRILPAVGLLAALPGLVDAVGAVPTQPTSISGSETTWAPVAAATIHPGVQTFTDGGQCTSNFVYTGGDAVYLGMAAHCAGTGGPTEIDGCKSPSLPLGTPVTIKGASHPGELAYSSWLTMQAVGETDPDVCLFNDLALIKINPADVGKTNPSIPFFGGPMGLASAGTEVGDAVYSYGNSELRLGLRALRPKRGVSVGDTGSGWSHVVYTVTPGVPGDSGSAFVDASGNALGVLSTLQLLPFPGSNGVGDLNKELEYLNLHSGLEVSLVKGTTTFKANRLL